MAKKRRGCINVSVDVDVEIDEVISEISDEVLLDECKERNLKIPIEKDTDKFDFNREKIAFYFGKSRYTPLPELMKLIQEKLESEF